MAPSSPSEIEVPHLSLRNAGASALVARPALQRTARLFAAARIEAYASSRVASHLSGEGENTVRRHLTRFQPARPGTTAARLRGVVVLSAAAVLIAAIAPSATDAASARRVKRDTPTRLFVMAGFTPDCAFKGFPELQLDQQPAKGQVDFKQGETTTLQTTLSGACVGAQVQGTGIYYTPAAGQTGEDTFTVTGRLGSGEPASKTFAIIIDE